MRRARTTTVVPALLAGALALAACGGGDGGSAGGGGDGGGDRQVKLRLAHVFPETSPVHEGARAFAEGVEEETDGSVEVQVFSGGTLGGDTEMGEGLTRGDLDCAMINHAVAGIDPRLQLGFLPYIVSSYEGADELFYGDGMIAEHDREILDESGVHALAFYENDFRGLTNTRRPVSSPADLKGLKIRVPELPAFVDLFKAWGAQPLPIAFPELYTALQQGTVDGQDNGIVLTFDSKFQEVQKYFTRTNHTYGAGVLACNKQVWDTLSGDQQTAVTDAAEEAMRTQVEANRASVEEKLQGLKDAGIEVIEPTPEQLEEFRAVRDQVWTAYEGTMGADVIAELRKASDEAAGA